jgi:hypothetical protein
MSNVSDYLVVGSSVILAIIGFRWRVIAPHLESLVDRIPPRPRRILLLLGPPLSVLLSVPLLIGLGRAYQANSSWDFGLKLVIVQFYFVPSFLFIAIGTALAPASKKAICLALGYFAILAWMIHTLIFHLAGLFTAWQFIHALVPTVLALKFVRDSVKEDSVSLENAARHNPET